MFIVILLASRGGAGGFGRSGARRTDGAGSLTFANLAGVDEAVEERGRAVLIATQARGRRQGEAVGDGSSCFLPRH
ncbi:MAG: hypothetical protein M3O70_27115 [Actinomycetota bacterium]|nr:hypothetical protein [Actinomycetota bacterium]